MPPPLSESTANRVHKMTDSLVGSPDATPNVKGSLARFDAGTGLVVGVTFVGSLLRTGSVVWVPEYFFEQATTATEALRAKNIRREIGEGMR